jgi:hypothetical protein
VYRAEVLSELWGAKPPQDLDRRTQEREMKHMSENLAEGLIRIERPVAMKYWGKDHWSTLAYAGVRAVDHKGVLETQRMRCDNDRHPAMAVNREVLGKKYPTILKLGFLLEDHDDWDCLDDAEHEGLIEIKGTGLQPIVQFTEKGKKVLALLQSHKMNGGRYSSFVLQDGA